MKSVPFEVLSLDPSQTMQSISSKLLMNSLSPYPARPFFPMGHAAAKKESVVNTCA